MGHENADTRTSKETHTVNGGEMVLKGSLRPAVNSSSQLRASSPPSSYPFRHKWAGLVIFFCALFHCVAVTMVCTRYTRAQRVATAGPAAYRDDHVVAEPLSRTNML